MADWAMKRFWTAAEVVETDAGFGVHLDGRTVKTPLKTAVAVPQRSVAQAMAAEWAAQAEKIDPLSMPVTRAVNATLDKVIPQKAAVADMLAEYGGTDLLCYRAEGPDRLVARQAQGWDPLLTWAATRFNAPLQVTTGIIPVPQPAASLGALRAAVHRMDPFEITAFHEFVTISGSLVIGLAAMEPGSVPHALWMTSRIDEDWQAEQWGADDEASRMAAFKRQAFVQAAIFLNLVRGDRG
jgi:chaperone required for assembly of F1-ATPase